MGIKILNPGKLAPEKKREEHVEDRDVVNENNGKVKS
jgi:hypothetical protein